MWPFTPKTLYDRYNKLMKLILSIDSHFEVTENKEDSVRLHLPNYKGNQPMDFHIYLLKPFLYISFVTEIEGAKISVLNYYHQDSDQQDMFNIAMSSNLEKVHEVLGRKYEDDSKKEDTCKKTTENQKDINQSKATKEKLDEDIEDDDNDEENEEETVEQRQALYYFVHKLTTPSYYQGDSLTSSLTLLTYKNTLELSDYEVDEILSTPFYKEDELIKDLKSIKESLTIYQFLYECVTLIDKTESGAAIPYFFSLIQELGLSIEEVRNGINLIETVPSEHFYDRIRKFSWEDLNDNEQADENKESSNKAKETQENGIPIKFLVEDLKENFDYNASFKRHALTFMILRPNTEFWYYAQHDDEKPLWIYNDKKDDKDRGVYMMDESYSIGLYPLLWYFKKYDDKESLCWLFDFLDRHNIDLWAQDYLEEAVDDNHPEELIKRMKRYVPSLKIGNDPQKIKENLAWSWIDIQSLLLFIKYCMNSLDWSAGPDENLISLQDCSSMSDLAFFIIKDMGVGRKSSSMKKDEVINLDENNDKISDEEREAAAWRAENIRRKLAEMEAAENLSSEVTEDDKANSWTDEYGVKYSGDGRKLLIAPKDLCDYSIREGTKAICNMAFRNCNELGTISIPESVILIGFSAFEGCANLKSIEIPNSISSIGVNAFWGCSRLFSIILSNQIRSIRNATFVDCKNLHSIKMPDIVRSIGIAAFSGCENLMFIGIPENVTFIGGQAFAGCRRLTSISIPYGVKKIEGGTFSTCSRLKSIDVPNSVTEIGEGAFLESPVLDSITITMGTMKKFRKLLPEHLHDKIIEKDRKNAKSIEEQAPDEVLISWMFQGFTKGYKRMIADSAFCPFTGSEEKALIFERGDGDNTIVYNLGGQTIEQINEKKDCLSIELRKSGCYYLNNSDIIDIIESYTSLLYVEEWDGNTIPNIEIGNSPDKTKDYNFAETWSIVEFSQKHGKMRVEQRRNEETGEEFASLSFTDNFGREINVLPFDNLGQFSLYQILRNIDVYRVGAAPAQYYTPSYYYLYDKTLNFWLPGMSI